MNAARQARIEALAASGWSNVRIAQEVGLSTERVRQLRGGNQSLETRRRQLRVSIARLRAELREVEEEIEASRVDHILGLDANDAVLVSQP